MHSSYNLWLVAISFVVATLASYTALDLTDRISLLTSAWLRHARLCRREPPDSRSRHIRRTGGPMRDAQIGQRG